MQLKGAEVKNRSKRSLVLWLIAGVILGGLISGVGIATAGSGASADKPKWFDGQNHTSDAIAFATVAAVPYPIALIKDSLERRNLRERLTRFSKPQKIGYLYLMSFGKFVGYYVVKGKVSSVQSQMTNPTQVWNCGGADGGCQAESIGDDGSFGPNEGGDKGIFFFTVQGVMVETTLDWVYSDAPLNIDVPNLLAKH